MERSVKIKLRIDFRTWKYFNMYNLLYRKKFYIIYGIIALFCLVAAVYTAIVSKEYIFSVALGLFAVYILYQTFNLENKIDQNIASYFSNHSPIEQLMTINDDEIIIESIKNPEQKINYDWVHVSAIHEIPQFFYCFIGKQPIIIDKDPNAIIEGDYDTLIDIIMKKVELKPYKKIDKEIVKKPITFVHQEFTDDQDKAEEIKVEIDGQVEEAGNPDSNVKDEPKEDNKD